MQHNSVPFGATASPEALDSAHAPIDSISYAAIIYLAVPIFIFLLGWFEWLPGLLLAAIFATGLGIALRSDLAPWRHRPETKAFVLVVLVAILWTLFGGAGHYYYANAHDWIIRDAVLRDLTVASWPPGYQVNETQTFILRAGIGYYLPAATLGKVFGPELADFFLWCWTALGTAIFLLLLPITRAKPWRMAAALFVVVTFSGMDILAVMFPDYHEGNLPMPGAFLDWWIVPPPLVHYWSNTTHLFWSPNHTLPAWIATAFVVRNWYHPRLLTYATAITATLPVWSPFSFIGLLPFLALRALQSPGDARRSVNPVLIACCLSIFAVTVLYLTAGVGRIQFGATATTTPEWGNFDYRKDFEHYLTFTENYFFFITFKFGVLAMLVWRHLERSMSLLAISILLLLPFVSFGPGNDLSINGAISAQTILCIATINFFQSAAFPRRIAKSALVVFVVLAGAVTPLFEFQRAIARPSWKPDLRNNLIDAANGRISTHYLTDFESNPLRSLMRNPSMLPYAIDWSRVCKFRHPESLRNNPFIARTYRLNRNAEHLKRAPPVAPAPDEQ